jgi:hypothetical protein
MDIVNTIASLIALVVVALIGAFVGKHYSTDRPSVPSKSTGPSLEEEKAKIKENIKNDSKEAIRDRFNTVSRVKPPRSRK